MIDLQPLAEQIRKGAPPDLYWGIRRLDHRFPVPDDVSQTFFKVALCVRRLFPSRVTDPIVNSFDARVVVIDFCHHHETTRDDVLRVLEGCLHHEA